MQRRHCGFATATRPIGRKSPPARQSGRSSQAEIRGIDPDARYFTPDTLPLDAELRRNSEVPPELGPAIDAAEVFLLAVFLRRYVTYCARRGRFAAMNGAARLLVELRASVR